MYMYGGGASPRQLSEFSVGGFFCLAISARLAKFSQYTVLNIIISSILTACMNVIGVRSTVCGLYMHLTRPLLDLVFFFAEGWLARLMLQLQCAF